MWWLSGLAIVPILFLTMRLRGAHFRWDRMTLAGLVGYPMFAYLLLRSKRAHARGSVSWKGRTYSGAVSRSDAKQISRPSGTEAETLLASHH